MEDKPLNPFDDTYFEVRLKRSPPPSPGKPEPEGGVGVLLIILLGLMFAAAIAFRSPLERSAESDAADVQPFSEQPVQGTMNSLPDNRSLHSAAVGGDTYIGEEAAKQRFTDEFEPPPPQTGENAIDSPDEQLQRPYETSEDSAQPEFFGIARVGNCEAEGANFRRAPSMESTILGVVPEGERVELTGGIEIVNGKQWYEAININPLRESTSLRAVNQLDVEQRGWIHGCYFSYLRDRQQNLAESPFVLRN